MMYMQPTTIFF